MSLREMRVAKGITQYDMAEILFVTQGTISNWETGATRPSVADIPRIAEVLGVSIEELVKSINEGD